MNGNSCRILLRIVLLKMNNQQRSGSSPGRFVFFIKWRHASKVWQVLGLHGWMPYGMICHACTAKAEFVGDFPRYQKVFDDVLQIRYQILVLSFESSERRSVFLASCCACTHVVLGCQLLWLITELDRHFDTASMPTGLYSKEKGAVTLLVTLNKIFLDSLIVR